MALFWVFFDFCFLSFVVFIFLFLSVYDVSKRATFDALNIWLKEIDAYSTNKDVIILLVGNKIDKVHPFFSFFFSHYNNQPKLGECLKYVSFYFSSLEKKKGYRS